MDLTLSLVYPRHLEDLANLYSLPDVLQGHGLEEPFPHALWKTVLDGAVSALGVHWVFLEKGSSKVLGHGALSQWMPNHSTSELFLSIHPHYWGQKLGERLAQLLFLEAKKLNQKYIWAGVVESNKRSCNLFIKLGFQASDPSPYYAQVDGVLVSRLIFTKELA